MDFIFDSGRIYLENTGGELLAELTYEEISEGTVNIVKVFVDESLRGKGVAGKLMTQLVEMLRKDERKAYPTCSYAVKWFRENLDSHDVYIDIME